LKNANHNDINMEDEMLQRAIEESRRLKWLITTPTRLRLKDYI